MMAGADFIKTSTGKEGVNAILPVGLVMARAIEEFYRETRREVGPTSYERPSNDLVSHTLR